MTKVDFAPRLEEHEDLESSVDAVGGAQGFASDTRLRFGADISIDDRIGDTVTDLVGMAFRHGFTGKKVA